MCILGCALAGGWYSVSCVLSSQSLGFGIACVVKTICMCPSTHSEPGKQVCRTRGKASTAYSQKVFSKACCYQYKHTSRAGGGFGAGDESIVKCTSGYSWGFENLVPRNGMQFYCSVIDHLPLSNTSSSSKSSGALSN